MSKMICDKAETCTWKSDPLETHKCHDAKAHKVDIWCQHICPAGGKCIPLPDSAVKEVK